MNKPIVLSWILLVIVISSCTPTSKTITFDEGVERINEIDKKFGASMKTVPSSAENVWGLIVQLTGFGAVNENMPESVAYLLDYRIKGLESEKLYMGGWQWGKASTIDYGFGCKGAERILNSSKLREGSAKKGYEAVNSLQLFVNEFPEEAKSLNLSQKDVIFLNATYYQAETKARSDASIVTKLCIKKEFIEYNETG